MEKSRASDGNLLAYLQINDLNDYCLIHIFGFVSIVERVRFVIVCKKWRDVIKDSWSKLKSIDLENFKLLGFEPQGRKHSARKVDVNVFRKILTKCGKYLESINANELVTDACPLIDIVGYCPNIKRITAENVTAKGLAKLAQKCKNLKELILFNEVIRNVENEDDECKDFVLENDSALSTLFYNNKKLQKLELMGIEFTGDCLKDLSRDSLEMLVLERCIDRVKFYHNVCRHLDSFIRSSKKLITFYYDECNSTILYSLGSSCSDLVDLRLTGTYYIDNIDTLLSEIFRKNRNLKLLKLYCFDGLTGSCFQRLNKDVIEDVTLYGNRTSYFNYDCIIMHFPTFTKLKALGFNIIKSSSNVIANYIVMYPNLKWLSVRCSEITLETSKELNVISITTSLEQLCIRNNQFVTDKFLGVVGKYLKELQYLDISYCEQVTDLGLEEISQLPKLIDLDVHWNKNIEGKGFQKFSTLKFLHSFECFLLKNEGLSTMIKNCKCLEFLNIIDCVNVTNDFIDVALQETKKRTNNVTLTIKCIGSFINVNLIRDISPFLRIVD